MSVVDQLAGKLIVSCQAYPGEPMRDPRTMTQVAQAAVLGGAAGIRAQGLADLDAMRPCVTVPLIGLVKVGAEGVFITPTLSDAIAVAQTGCDIVAIDGTRRPRPDGLTLSSTVAAFRQQCPGVLVMADCGSLDDGLAAEDADCDLIGTTLAGYTGERPRTDGPDFALLDQLVGRITRPVVAEGRISTPAQAAEALQRGASSVVVGTAITHPTTLTRRFVEAAAHRTDS